MIRSAFAALAAATIATPAPAGEINYRAESLAALALEAPLILGGLVWKCGVTECVAGKSSRRPLVDGQALARKIGALRSFTAAGRLLTAPELEKCNSRARSAF